MADDITDKCARLQIIQENDDILDFSTENLEEKDVKIRLRLVGKLLTDNPLILMP